mmetsp:Transcript_73989/g.128400  ORF Transcript_73989/g.128400 Transcript_73989/m.128400 type:complete len:89 (-) Transcript_73989:1443-1709(-)
MAADARKEMPPLSGTKLTAADRNELLFASGTKRAAEERSGVRYQGSLPSWVRDFETLDCDSDALLEHLSASTSTSEAILGTPIACTRS